MGEQAIRRLQRQVSELREERDILKQALAVFSSRRRSDTTQQSTCAGVTR